MDRFLYGLYVITDDKLVDFRAMLKKTEAILQQGICALQYRNKHDPASVRMEQAVSLHDLCLRYDTPLIINDNVEMAAALDCAGVHLGRDDVDCSTARMRLGSDKIIGVSCYNDLARAEAAVAGGADYIAFGAMYPSRSKSDTVHATPDLLTHARKRYQIPVVAIGGISPANCDVLIRAGADMLAVISSVYQAPNVVNIVRAYKQRFQAAKHESI